MSSALSLERFASVEESESPLEERENSKNFAVLIGFFRKSLLRFFGRFASTEDSDSCYYCNTWCVVHTIAVYVR